jgi:hypothetical protein
VNRFDFGVVLATVLVLLAIAVIRNIVVPIVRVRVSRYRLALNSPAHARDALSRERNAQFGQSIDQIAELREQSLTPKDETR